MTSLETQVEGGQDAIDYDPLAFSMHPDPYPTYRLLRDLHPAFHDSRRGFWVLTRFDDVQRAARDWQTFSSTPHVDIDDTPELVGPGNFLDYDPPRHDLFRRMVAPRFAPKAIAAMEPFIRAVVTDLLDRLEEAPNPDLARDLAWPLPPRVVLPFLGFPAADHEWLRGVFVRMLRREPGSRSLPADAVAAHEELREYFKGLARYPDDVGDGLAGDIVAAGQSGQISSDEAIGCLFLVFLAGMETTVGLVSNAALLLARHPEQRALLADGIVTAEDAIEEVLRYEAPVQYLARSTTRAVELHGSLIPTGDRVLLVWAAANRDERRWDDPDRFAVDREPLRHLAFGEGIHFCVGAPLARLEARIALSELLRRFPEYQQAGEVERYPTHNGRALARLPVGLAGSD